MQLFAVVVDFQNILMVDFRIWLAVMQIGLLWMLRLEGSHLPFNYHYYYYYYY